ncbi:MAG TPA: glycosyltransferase family 1 protein, partial [Actinobacteria bacterium]|nr:glycosyltransferase family 1 protein [Actinomycetota bacterium]
MGLRGMRILQINRLWRPSSSAGRYMLELSRLLEQRGHEVIPFAVQDPGNQASAYSSLYVSPLNLLNPFRMSLGKILGTGARVLYSREARNRAAALADYSRPDIAHVHKIDLHMSPSVLPPLSRRGVGIVMTVHDNKLFCPARQSYQSGAACYRCRPYHYGGCIRGTCVDGSRLASSLGATELLAHDLLHAYTGKVDCFIAPSWYMADRLAARGVTGSQVAVIPYFVDTDAWRPSGSGDGEYALYSGRLLPREGIKILIKAFAALPQVPLKIAGTGILDHQARKLAWELGAENIEFLGYRTAEETRSLLAGSRMLCLPYESPGNVPQIVLQAFAMGVPAIGTSIGGLPEVIRHGRTGMLAQPGDVDSLKEVVFALWRNPGLCREMGQEARGLMV